MSYNDIIADICGDKNVLYKSNITLLFQTDYIIEKVDNNKKYLQ